MKQTERIQRLWEEAETLHNSYVEVLNAIQEEVTPDSLEERLMVALNPIGVVFPHTFQNLRHARMWAEQADAGGGGRQ